MGVTLAVGGAVALFHGMDGNAPRGLRDAPDFELKDAGEVWHRLSALKGTPVVLHFWASWCPPCRAEIPDWLKLATRFEGKKVKFVAISEDRKWADAFRLLPQSSLPPNVLSLLDDSGKVPDRFGTFEFPETYLIDSDGRIVVKWVGLQNWAAPEIQGLIEREVDHLNENWL